MVKKLFKHECNAYLRTVIPMHLVLIGIALLGRFVQLFDNNSDAYNIFFVSTVIVFAIGCIVCTLLTLVFGIKRFYTNMFSTEGYLTLTLPVSATQHIFVKTVVAVLMQFSSFLMIALSVCVITFGDVCVELFKAEVFFIKNMYETIGAQTILIILEFVVCAFVSVCSAYLIYFACIALGQRAKKNRVATSVGIFFAYYMIVQFISTIMVIVISTMSYNINMEKIAAYISAHPTLPLHMAFAIAVVIDSLLGLLAFTITKNTITKKLNIE